MELHGVALVLVGRARRVPPGPVWPVWPWGGMSCACAMSIEVTLESAVSGAQLVAAWARLAEARDLAAGGDDASPALGGRGTRGDRDRNGREEDGFALTI